MTNATLIRDKRLKNNWKITVHCVTFADSRNISESSSVGRASASQAEGREFEPRLSLHQRPMRTVASGVVQ